MNTLELANELANNSYPGRGIVIGLTPDKTSAVIGYFIMGRSNNSRNRVFIPHSNDLVTQAADPSKMEDPSLIIYAPVRTIDTQTIVTNGDQTDTIYDHIASGKTFEDGLATRTFEPDAPNYTPRISGVVDCIGGDCTYKLSILKSCNHNPDSVQRFFYEYKQPVAGQGHFIHTYACDGDPIPSFTGEPKNVNTINDIDDFTNMLWSSLHKDNKVSLFVRYIDLATSETNDRIINQYSQV